MLTVDLLEKIFHTFMKLESMSQNVAIEPFSITSVKSRTSCHQLPCHPNGLHPSGFRFNFVRIFLLLLFLPSVLRILPIQLTFRVFYYRIGTARGITSREIFINCL